MKKSKKQKKCGICSQLKDEEYSFYKGGQSEGNTSLPAAANKLKLIKDLSHPGSRLIQLKQCPECKTYYLYRTDYEFLVNGTEDEEFLTRLTDAEAEKYLKQEKTWK